jgi:type I restriction enzyme, S subunit
MSQYSQHDGINDMATAYQTDRPAPSDTPAPAAYQEEPQNRLTHHSDPVQQLLANLDLWTGTVTEKTGGRGRGAGKTELTGIKKLRELILELAVRGKLVPQNPNDEPASALLKRIEAEKVQLVKDGKIKKPAKLPPVSDDEQPFELPNGWEWVRLAQLAEINPKNDVADESSASFVPMTLVSTHHTGQHEFEERKWGEIKKGFTQFADGDVAIAKITPCFENSKAAVFSRLINGVGAGTTELHVARPYAFCCPRFFLLVFKSPRYLSEGEQKMTGSAGQKRVPKTYFAENPIPLPPLAEQQRIVERVDQLMALCDQLEQGCLQQLDNHQQLVDTLLAELTAAHPSPASDSSIQALPLPDSAAAITTAVTTTSAGPDAPEHNSAWQRIHDQFDRLFSGAIQTAFPPLKTKGQTAGQAELVEAQSILVGAGNSDWAIDRLKETILQLAVMGRLVPQNESDEPASALLKRIDAEKARLVKDGKIKKPKKLPPISDDEKPFDLPDGWELIHLLDISQEIGTGPFGSMIHKSEYIENGTPLINPSHMINDRVCEDTTISVSEEKAEDLSSYKLRDGDMVLARRGEVGRCAVVTARENGWLCGTGSFYLRLATEINRAFMVLVFKVPTTRNYLAGKAVGTTMVNLNHGILNNLPIALPPLAEQQRIVERIDQLFALCDQLKAKQQAASQTRQQLTEALVEQVLG